MLWGCAASRTLGLHWHRLTSDGRFGDQLVACGARVDVQHVYHCCPEAGPTASPAIGRPCSACVVPHGRDEDCAPHLRDDGTCDVCGVAHGEPCDRCGGRGYHRDDCAEVEPRAALCDRCWLPGDVGARCDRPDVLRAMLCEGTVVEVPPAGVARCASCGRRHVNLGDECADCAVDAMLPATVRIPVEPMRELIASGER